MANHPAAYPVKGVAGYTVGGVAVRHPGVMRRTGQTARWWRACRFLAVEGAAALVSLAFVVAGLLVAALMLLIVGWLVVPTYLRLLRLWAGRARRRTAQYTGVAIAQRYPPIAERPGFADVRAMLMAASTRREVAWLVLHGFGALIVGVVAVMLSLSVVNSLLIPTYWWAVLPTNPPAVSTRSHRGPTLRRCR